MNDMFPTFRKLLFSNPGSFIESLAFKGALWGLFVLAFFLPLMVLLKDDLHAPLALLSMVVGAIGIFVLIGRPASPGDAVRRGVKVAGVPTGMLVLLALSMAFTAEPLGGAYVLFAAALCALSGVLGSLVIFWIRSACDLARKK